MNNPAEISHEAIVQTVDSDAVTVSLSQAVSCAGCLAEKSCGMNNSSSRIFRIEGSYSFQPGDRVNILMKISQGYAALFLGYILPLILVITTLIILSAVGTGELITGLVSVAILIPYYIILWLYRRYFSRKFLFKIITAV